MIQNDKALSERMIEFHEAENNEGNFTGYQSGILDEFISEVQAMEESNERRDKRMSEILAGGSLGKEIRLVIQDKISMDDIKHVVAGWVQRANELEAMLAEARQQLADERASNQHDNSDAIQGLERLGKQVKGLEEQVEAMRGLLVC